MYRLILAALAALFIFSTPPAQAAEKSCTVSGMGYLTQGGSMVRRFGERLANTLKGTSSDVQKMFSINTANPSIDMVDIIDLWRFMNCNALEGPDFDKAARLRKRWAEALGIISNDFTDTYAQKRYTQKMSAAKDLDNDALLVLRPIDLQLLADTAAWAQSTGNPRFARTLQAFTQALNLPPPRQ